ncbi:host-nuclease inhibitor Gam family protein [Thermoanaerobacter thermohydrosulfuricus]
MLDNLLREEYYLDIEEEILNEIERESVKENPNGIHDDKYADWTIEKIKLLSTELERKKMIVENKKRYLDEWFEKEKKNIENKIAFYTSRLQEYFESLDPRLLHKTKTQLSYSLPSGKLKKMLEKDEFERRDEELLDWLKKNNYTSFIKVKESVDWAKLKESIKISGEKAILKDTGEIIEGIRIVKKPAEFKVE